MRRLLLLPAEAPERWAFRLHWSAFRRAHQAMAKRGHVARRAAWQAAEHAARSPAAPLPSGSAPILALVGTAALTEDRWQQIRQVVPPQRPARGRPRLDHRRMLEAMLWVMRSGRTWRELPPRLGPWQSVYSRYQHWCREGMWSRIRAILHPDDDGSLFDA